MPSPIAPSGPLAAPAAHRATNAAAGKAPAGGRFAGVLAAAAARPGDSAMPANSRPAGRGGEEIDPRQIPPGIAVSLGNLRGFGDSARTAPTVEAPGRGLSVGEAALLQQIAGRVVSAVEVLHRSGQPEVRLSLDLGPLGQTEVSVARSTGGRVEINFRTEGPQAADLLSRHAGELRDRLADRGIEAREIRVDRVDRGDGAALVAAPGRETPPAAPRTVPGAASGSEAGSSGRQGGRGHEGGHENQGRSRNRYQAEELERSGEEEGRR
ncbi:MAG TPA: flagellar hook-length control protein FliK [Thermoanaerobaculia bacterium]|nr:flagellar hook-length control protein FliK [Thermoanaerobaculia bacterium]